MDIKIIFVRCLRISLPIHVEIILSKITFTGEDESTQSDAEDKEEHQVVGLSVTPTTDVQQTSDQQTPVDTDAEQR